MQQSAAATAVAAAVQRKVPSASLNGPRSLTELCVELSRVMGGKALCHEDGRLSELRQLMDSFDHTSGSAEWRRFAHYDPEHAYTRNLVDDGRGAYNLLVLCWGNGKGSPIHDHDNAHCLLKVLQGHLEETQYDWPRQALALDPSGNGYAHAPMTAKHRGVYGPGQLTYINDRVGLHSVRNVGRDGSVAVSLHLYSPPMVSNMIFCPRTSSMHTVGPYSYFTANLLRVATSDSGDTTVASETDRNC